MTADAKTLAQEFSVALRSLLTSEQKQSVILRNASETEPDVCHSHDFCDANVVMHEVFLDHEMDPTDEGAWISVESFGARPGISPNTLNSMLPRSFHPDRMTAWQPLLEPSID